jgi:hypothetical protein
VQYSTEEKGTTKMLTGIRMFEVILPIKTLRFKGSVEDLVRHESAVRPVSEVVFNEGATITFIPIGGPPFRSFAVEGRPELGTFDEKELEGLRHEVAIELDPRRT